MRPNYGQHALRLVPDQDNYKGTGRLRAIDLRDDRFRLGKVDRQLKAARVLKTSNAGKTFRHWWIDRDLPIDQMQTSACTGFSTAGVIMVGPVTHEGYRTFEEGNKLGRRLYAGALDNDEWQGNDPCCGSSVRAAVKTAVDAGFFKSFAWAYTVDEIVEWLLRFGPGIFGIVWPDSFMRTDKHGYLQIGDTATLSNPHAAGHAIAAVGVNTSYRNPDGTKGFVELLNSWGKPWGREGNGTARLTLATVPALLAADGEFCCPVDQKIKAA
jgi:hypothetical protein